jgi:hypothetical protein
LPQSINHQNPIGGTSLTPQQEKLKQLKQLLPEAFAEGKIDWEKLSLKTEKPYQNGAIPTP